MSVTRLLRALLLLVPILAGGLGAAGCGGDSEQKTGGTLAGPDPAVEGRARASTDATKDDFATKKR